MPRLTLSHFEATIILALAISIVLGAVAPGTARERITYGAKCFGYFLLAVFGIGWLMYLGHG